MFVVVLTASCFMHEIVKGTEVPQYRRSTLPPVYGRGYR